MKRWISLIVTIILMISTLCGCHRVPVTYDEAQPLSMFVVVERADIWEVCYQKDTKVMYLVNTHNYGNFTVMVNPDGTPQLWDKE